MNKVLMRKFNTTSGYPVYVNMDNVVRLWVEPPTLPDGNGGQTENTRAGQTALMYPGGMVDHVEETLKEVLYGKGCN